ncbi:hemolysin family protein [Puerhibacterium sp. TATVAM-FAB25]|uniref:hemolysin family protein n=1 Tax=Puerhibacterium sp. TATVAM-FAB25 TaxID=3093699 RepID=UPI00397909E7
MDAPTLLLLVVAAAGLTLTALLAAGEAAVLRVTRTSLVDALTEAEAGEGLRSETRADHARAAQALLLDPPGTVAALGIVRAAAEIVALGALTLALAGWLPAWWQTLLVLLVLGVVAGLVTVRVSPRRIGHRRPLRVLLALSGLLTVVARATAWAVRRSVQREPEAPPTEAELRDMVERVGESQVFEEDERELFRSVLELRGTLAREVMVPRTDMVTTHRDTPLRKVMRLFLRSGFSRLPVVGASVDDLVGVAYLKDVARVLDTDPSAGDRPVAEVVRPAVFVPESKPVDDLLRQMQTSAHIAVVIDEYGGTAGLVTIEDVLEELVGELTDEHDRVAVVEPEELGDGVWRVPSRLPVDELGELFDLRLDDDDVDTAGGLLAKALGKVPLAGSAADVGGLHLVADRVEGRRKQLATLLVSRAETTEQDTADGAEARTSDQREHP